MLSPEYHRPAVDNPIIFTLGTATGFFNEQGEPVTLSVTLSQNQVLPRATLITPQNETTFRIDREKHQTWLPPQYIRRTIKNHATIGAIPSLYNQNGALLKVVLMQNNMTDGAALLIFLNKDTNHLFPLSANSEADVSNLFC